MRPRPAVFLGALLVLALPAAAQLPPWLARGERLTYNLTLLRLVGGTMVLQAHQEDRAKPFAIDMCAVSSAFVSRFAPVDDRMATLLDPGRFTTLVSRKDIAEGSYRSREVVRFDPTKGTARRWKNGVEEAPLRTPVPVLDTLGSIYYLRTLDLSVGGAYRVAVQSGHQVYPLTVTVSRVDTLHTLLGRTRVLVIEPEFRGSNLLHAKGRLTLYLTTDKTHTPVRITSNLPFGSLTADLASIERPLRSVLESPCGLQAGREEIDGSQAR